LSGWNRQPSADSSVQRPSSSAGSLWVSTRAREPTKPSGEISIASWIAID
jgi:hypothetical protein